MPLTGDVVGQKRQIFRYDAGSAEPRLRLLQPDRGRPGRRRQALRLSARASPAKAASSSTPPSRLSSATPTARSTSTSGARRTGCSSSRPATASSTTPCSRSAATAPTPTSSPATPWSPRPDNGELMKIYDARAGGGFLVPARTRSLRRLRRVPRRRHRTAGAAGDQHGRRTKPAKTPTSTAARRSAARARCASTASA